MERFWECPDPSGQHEARVQERSRLGHDGEDPNLGGRAFVDYVIEQGSQGPGQLAAAKFIVTMVGPVGFEPTTSGPDFSESPAPQGHRPMMDSGILWAGLNPLDQARRRPLNRADRQT